MALWSLDVFEAWNRAFGQGGVRICSHLHGCMPSLATLGASMLKHTRANLSKAVACHEPEGGGTSMTGRSLDTFKGLNRPPRWVVVRVCR